MADQPEGRNDSQGIVLGNRDQGGATDLFKLYQLCHLLIHLYLLADHVEEQGNELLVNSRHENREQGGHTFVLCILNVIYLSLDLNV